MTKHELPSKEMLGRDFRRVRHIRWTTLLIIICSNAFVLYNIYDEQQDFNYRLANAYIYPYVFTFSAIIIVILYLRYKDFEEYQNDRLTSIEKIIKQEDEERVKKEKMKKENDAIRERLK